MGYTFGEKPGLVLKLKLVLSLFVHCIFYLKLSYIEHCSFQAEYHYLFDAAIKLHQLGLDWSTPNRVPICNANTVCGNSQRNVQKRFHSSIDTTDPPQDGNKEFFRIKRNTQLKKLMNDYCDRHSVEYNSPRGPNSR
ncbi:hypothetical protein RD792_006261 [Penstemon davidsonii]|uniref:Uncharacterized protein n=1 Tax=Penstemon davidsonii TaxID=160366 RepID=A0ABR0DCG0_9LAMI|nr:hypothetical protein RD792_006261 [Penstemon davidsonii]